MDSGFTWLVIDIFVAGRKDGIMRGGKSAGDGGEWAAKAAGKRAVLVRRHDYQDERAKGWRLSTNRHE